MDEHGMRWLGRRPGSPFDEVTSLTFPEGAFHQVTSLSFPVLPGALELPRLGLDRLVHPRRLDHALLSHLGELFNRDLSKLKQDCLYVRKWRIDKGVDAGSLCNSHPVGAWRQHGRWDMPCFTY